MPIETKYEVTDVAVLDDFPELTVPMIARIITVDGAEVSREYPVHAEVVLAQPELVEVYFNALSAYFANLSSWVDEQTTFTREQFVRLASVRIMINDYTQKFDQTIDPKPNNMGL